ncbi:hypothetical protein [Actinacidiphila acididurans]|uniref:Uncharacterized protein n=1 Tax=Actinacidiphila acididurans TaxID=2784346 RepID=A0ABS2TZZ5_9ACTN|nr:hypothetical protein [Actinacidiphila acididurans]MBM9508918.1 hypothetical protein [Actinacidiphila acididurans]
MMFSATVVSELATAIGGLAPVAAWMWRGERPTISPVIAPALAYFGILGLVFATLAVVLRWVDGTGSSNDLPRLLAVALGLGTALLGSLPLTAGATDPEERERRLTALVGVLAGVSACAAMAFLA